MLSPGTYYKSVPTDRVRNLKFRIAMMERCRKEPKYQAAVQEMCRQDIVFWINTFVYQYNPKKKGRASVGPFVCWDFQVKALLDGKDAPLGPGILWCIENDRDLIIEKSREMGASWLCLLVAVWMFLYHPYTAVLCISRSAWAVEKTGDHKSLFWKVDHVLSHLPKWMLGGYDPASDECKQKMLRAHPNGSTITGEASSGKAGVGGRATWMLIDEFSQIEEAREVLRRTAATSAARIFSGTHKGMGSVFKELCDPSSAAGSFIQKRVMHWTEHPDKNKGLYRWSTLLNRIEVLDDSHIFPPGFKFVSDGKPAGGPRPGVRSPWYDQEVQRIGDDTGVAEDLDINPAGTVAEVFDAVKINHLIEHYSRPPDWIGELDFSNGPAKLAPDRVEGHLHLWLLPDGLTLPPMDGGYVVAADIAEGVGATPTCFAGYSCRTGEKLLEYTNGMISPEDAARYAVALCKCLCDSETGEPAMLIWEMQGPGTKFGKTVTEALGYRNIYYRVQEQKLAPLAKADVPGWYPSPDGKDQILRDYRQGLYERKCVNYSKPALQECLMFEVDKSGHYKHAHVLNPKNNHHAEINHGDHATADALGWKMVIRIGKLTRHDKDREKVAEVTVGSYLWRREQRERKMANSQWD